MVTRKNLLEREISERDVWSSLFGQTLNNIRKFALDVRTKKFLVDSIKGKVNTLKKTKTQSTPDSLLFYLLPEIFEHQGNRGQSTSAYLGPHGYKPFKDLAYELGYTEATNGINMRVMRMRPYFSNQEVGILRIGSLPDGRDYRSIELLKFAQGKRKTTFESLGALEFFSSGATTTVFFISPMDKGTLYDGKFKGELEFTMLVSDSCGRLISSRNNS